MKRNSPGMTVVELLVGMVVALAFVGLIIQTYSVTMRLSKKGISRVERLEEAQLIMDQLAKDLHSTVISGDTSGQIGFQLTTTSHAASKLQLVHRTTSAPLEMKLEGVEYSLGVSSRITRTLTGFDSTDTSAVNRPVGLGLEETEYILKMECLDNSSTGMQWTPIWNEPSPPKLVQIHLEIKDREKTTEPPLKLSRTIQVGGI